MAAAAFSSLMAFPLAGKTRSREGRQLTVGTPHQECLAFESSRRLPPHHKRTAARAKPHKTTAPLPYFCFIARSLPASVTLSLAASFSFILYGSGPLCVCGAFIPATLTRRVS